jgi:arylsulfatase A-like enzyme|tara:strand:+ start:232 stop:1665 length:1434 start_codon:yes stop_codon:yes gene_type:complete
MSDFLRRIKSPIIALLFLIINSPSLLAAADKPNIVLVLMDNFGYGEIGVYGGGVMRGAPTPRIDSIAAEGLQLTNFNVEAECTPSRSSLMTGRYGIRTRLGRDGQPRGIWDGLSPWEITIPEMLADQGYSTGMFGKWHLGASEGRFPTDQGFDEWYGIPNSSDHSFWPDSDSFQADAGVEFTRVMTAKRGEKPKKHEVYGREKRALIDREITDHALDFISRKAKGDKPFFAYIPYTQTHEPVDAHPDFKGSTGNGSFADVLAQTDTYVGELLDRVEKLGLKDNTIFIFTSDNGREGVQRSFGSTGIWRGTMFTPYEGSLRVPFLIRYPGKIPAKRVSNEIVHLIDLFPTFANIVGGDIPQDRTLDGVDQTDFFMAKVEKSPRETVMIYIGNELFGVKWRNWKMLTKHILIDGEGYAIKSVSSPSVYNLLIDPKEEEPEKFYLDDTWVKRPMMKAIRAHKASLKNDSGGPDVPVSDGY